MSEIRNLKQAPVKDLSIHTDTQIIQLDITKGEILNIFDNLDQIGRKHKCFNIVTIKKCLDEEIPTAYAFMENNSIKQILKIFV